MINLNDGQRGGTFTLSGAFGIGDGAKTGVAITTALAFCIDGVRAAKAAAATNLPLTAAGVNGTAVQPAQSTCLYLLVTNAAGVVSSVMGKPILSTILANTAAVLTWPELPANVAPFGAVRITTGATTFQPGTTALDAANVTAAYIPLFALPANPLTA